MKSRPQMEFPRILMPWMVDWAQFTMMLMCFSHLRLVVMKTPRYQSEVTVVMLWHFAVSLYQVPQILPLVRLGWQNLEKTMSLVFAGSAESPLFWSQASVILKLSMVVWVVAVVVVEVVKIVLLLTYSMRLQCFQYVASSRSEAVYSADRISERGKP